MVKIIKKEILLYSPSGDAAFNADVHLPTRICGVKNPQDKEYLPQIPIITIIVFSTLFNQPILWVS